HYPNNAEANLLLIELRAPMERAVVQREYERRLKAEPENALLYFLLGKAHDEPAEQVRLYRKAVELEPELAQAHLELGRVCRSKAVNDLAASRRALDAAVSLGPDWAEARLELARTLSAQGQLPEAAAEYRRAVERDPALEAAWFELACLQSRTEPGATEKTLAEAVRRCPASGRLWWHLADFQWTRGARADAAGAIERALALDAKASWAPEARDRLAAHYLCHGWHGKARRLGATAWSEAADEMAAGRLSAEAFRLLSHPNPGAAAERVERLERAARLAPKSAAVQTALGDALFAAGRYDAAAAAYAKVRTSRPGDAGALRRYVEAELLAGQPAAALKALGADRRRIGPDAALLIADAEALAARQLAPDAIAARYAHDRQDACPTKREEWQRLLRECIARFPAYLTPRLELARSLHAAGNATEAKSVLDAAAGVKGHPLAEADREMQLGDAAMAAKEYPKAVEHYRAAIARCPDLARQHGALARACAAAGQLGPAHEALTRQL
ncbi:MAG: tetratricopeptide repeat protein, partial [Planctomycetes bacterium]|nr:tetratricopeptide repeat protein [Planctomycetota bacterium]